MSEDDLTAREREALDRLPREAPPGDLLEERTVRLLENWGLLNRPIRRDIATRSRRAVAAVAAVAALALGSFWLGRWSSRPLPEEIPAPEQSRDLRLAAREVQRAGSEYILALEAFARARRGDPRDLEQGREVARVTLNAAANQVLDLVAERPVHGGPREGPRDEQLVWF